MLYDLSIARKALEEECQLGHVEVFGGPHRDAGPGILLADPQITDDSVLIF